MSDLFTGLQQGLRDFKNNHGIDMSHPNGSIIYGKPYPAIHKSVWIDTTTKNNKNTFQYRFDIPLENGHRVSVSKRLLNDYPSTISQIHIPTRYIFKQPNGTNVTSNVHRDLQVDGIKPGIPNHLKELMAGVSHSYNHDDNDNDMFHDYVKSVSRLPRFGTAELHVRDSKPSFENNRVMTDDELNEHFQNTRNNLRKEEHPHNIHVYLEEEKRIRQYDYDIKTEKLTTDEEWE